MIRSSNIELTDVQYWSLIVNIILLIVLSVYLWINAILPTVLYDTQSTVLKMENTTSKWIWFAVIRKIRINIR